ncbi:hypothetical protein [Pseudonocardia asaccharolytica]|uniref:Uncharacterized protein n=1 Tax=Pseudonocardia asaccharolytica DSM 44247 = NBRC 16224 TaxID=1123024 RepID=A0A511CYL3_9PSEU|nr:hypothetical protein [Pseudonocardia asaccharolytica]GEL17636.1 hypothetical protein PA7_14730 [Pseudonocardia asaccharolytica DSM 44247 = NBRC 16224]
MPPPPWPLVPSLLGEWTEEVCAVGGRIRAADDLDRPAYLTITERADSGDYGALGALIAQRHARHLMRFVVLNVAGPARLVPLAALVSEDFSLAALRQAAQHGRLDAVQGADGGWRSSRKALDAYRATKHRRRPKVQQ